MTPQRFKLSLFRRPFARLDSPTSLRSTRLEVRPPSLRHAPSSMWQRVMFWIMAPEPMDAAPPLNRLPGVQSDFLSAIADIDAEAACDLSHRIGNARSLRELWHMRLDVYNLIALHHSEFDAAQRLARLNHHFPVRTPRTTQIVTVQ